MAAAVAVAVAVAGGLGDVDDMGKGMPSRSMNCESVDVVGDVSGGAGGCCC